MSAKKNENPYFQLSIDRNSLLEGVGRRHEERLTLLTGKGP